MYAGLTKRDNLADLDQIVHTLRPGPGCNQELRIGPPAGDMGRANWAGGYPSPSRAKIFRLITLIHTIPTDPARFGSIFFIQNGVYGMATVQNRVEK